MKKYITAAFLILAAFFLGFLIRDLMLGDKKTEHTIATYGDQITDETHQDNFNKEKDLTKEAQKKYYELMADYIEYIKEQGQNSPISLDEFIGIRRDKLVQQDRYTQTDETLDNEILEWFISSEQSNSGTLRHYSVFGDILGLKNINQPQYDILIGALFSPMNDIQPSIPTGHIAFERPRYYDYLNKDSSAFELDLVLQEDDNGNTEAVNLFAIALPNKVPYNSIPTMAGTDDSISGVPASMLSRRKNNQPVKIKLKKLAYPPYSILDIANIKDGIMVSLYGIDSINKLDPDIDISRTVISTKDGVARLRSIINGSNVLLSSINDNHGFSFETILTGRKNKIELSKKPWCRKGYSCLTIVRPQGIDDPEITIYSKEPKLKFSKSIKKDLTWTINTPSIEDGLLELRANGKSLGIMRINSIKDSTKIIEPVYKNIRTFYGQIKKIASSTKVTPCNNCKISIKLSEKEDVCNGIGSFLINDIDIIDAYMDILVEDKDVETAINIPIIYGHDKLELNTEVPTNEILRYWSMSTPTMPGNIIIYGNIPYHRSYRAFLVGINSPITKEAIYFNKHNMPDRTLYSTDPENSSSGFSKFIFPNMAKGEYVLYLISGEDIIHSRIIHVDKIKSYVLN